MRAPQTFRAVGRRVDFMRQAGEPGLAALPAGEFQHGRTRLGAILGAAAQGGA